MSDEEALSVFEGYMFMQGSSMWKPWNWKARYFILTNECLYCFKRRGDLASIPHDVMYLDDAALAIDELRRGLRKRYYIRLSSSRQRKSFNLFCFLLDERNEWFCKILQVLAHKYTNKKPKIPKTFERMPKTHSLGESGRHSVLETLEQRRPMSISCLELTNLDVIDDPTKEIRTVTPIRKTLTIPTHPSMKRTKFSASSLDISIVADDTCMKNVFDILKNIEPKQRPKSESDAAMQRHLIFASKGNNAISKKTKLLPPHIENNNMANSSHLIVV